VQMRGIGMRQLMGPDLFAKNEPHVTEVLAGKDQQFERTLVMANGETSHTWAQYIADYKDGDVCGFFVLVSDITALRNAQLQIENSAAALRLAAIAFEGQEGILITDEQRRVLKANAAFTRIMGYPLESILGQRTFQMRSTRHTDEFYDGILASVESTGTWWGDLWFRHANGHDLPLSLHASAVPNEEGRITHYVFTILDISDQVQREEQRRNAEAIQRAALVREVHHRIKNNLQGITGLLRSFGKQHPETAPALDLAVGQLTSIATIHGLQGQAGAEQVALSAMLRAIAGHVAEIWRVPIATDEVPAWRALFIAEEECVPLAMIFNELLLNAVKHSDPACRGAAVSLHFHLESTVATVRITNKVAQGAGVHKDPLSGSGQPLMSQLMPSAGAQMNTAQRDGEMAVELVLSKPVLVLKYPHDLGNR